MTRLHHSIQAAFNKTIISIFESKLPQSNVTKPSRKLNSSSTNDAICSWATRILFIQRLWKQSSVSETKPTLLYTALSITHFSTTTFLPISLSGQCFLRDREQFVFIGNKNSTKIQLYSNQMLGVLRELLQDQMILISNMTLSSMNKTSRANQRHGWSSCMGGQYN